ncbi:hypothetical protein E2C01_002948 [Portunus trituberculatus]|uniref:Uncharacterized protein n=1 Tax=Portunus trituberculatus TaxID=210409 RepID=A0A5B7CNV2_PORTR|nr:hypothetical protein [Portunus trituberculatus]
MQVCAGLEMQAQVKVMDGLVPGEAEGRRPSGVAATNSATPLFASPLIATQASPLENNRLSFSLDCSSNNI